MIQGTSSHVGKSVIVAAVCRILSRFGLSVAPFKAQNMALNSFVTRDGSEIGVAQAFQAEACGVEPTADMNPILLKPTADSVSQVIIQGRVHGTMSAREYHAFKSEARGFVIDSYERLSRSYDVVVIEGAGSPAEVNLREGDIANMGAAEMTDSPVIIVGDIDRGGVFASLVGTMELLTPAERTRVKGFIINKFRGDVGLLLPGLEFLADKTGVPVLGVIPYMKDAVLPDEDGVALEKGGGGRSNGSDGADKVRVVVVRLPRISNFTDFDPLKGEPSVDVSFITDPAGLEGASMVVIPGSKNTLEDLDWLKNRGFAGPLSDFKKSGGMVAGICGGFQMLGKVLRDPHGVESALGTVEGLGMIGAETVLGREKKTFQIRATVRVPGTDELCEVTGYEIHMGETRTETGNFSMITLRGGAQVDVPDGAVGDGALVWGTYIHGLFDNDRFRNSLIEFLAKRNGSAQACADLVRDFRALRNSAIDDFADLVKDSLQVDKLLDIIGLKRSLVV